MTLYLILIGLLLLWIIIYPVTDAYVRWMAPSVIRRGKISGKRIHLSFDDGPDPDNTLKFLDILREMKVPATFFLVGEKAVRHPELVQYIIRDGHHIGLHTQYHRHAYLMGPGKSLDSVIKGKRVLEEVSRQPIIFFRPPWGALNLFEYGISKILGLKVVLWTANAQDWEKGTGMAGILERLFRKTTSGTIIVLHDSGGESGAPQNTLLALPKIITQFQSQGYEFVTLSEIIGGQ